MEPRNQLSPAGRLAQAAALLCAHVPQGQAVAACTGTGVDGIDEILPWGGLPAGLHEIAAMPGDATGAAFAVALAGRRPLKGPVLWCRLRRTAIGSGSPYGSGLAGLGVAPERLILVEVPKPTDLLWAVEEAARTKGLAAVVAEGAAPNLTASRRLQLAAEAGNGLVFLLQTGRQAVPSTALTRWFVSSAPSLPDAGGPGHPCWRVELWRCRSGGRPCEWTVEWDDATLSLSVVSTLSDRSLAATA